MRPLDDHHPIAVGKAIPQVSVVTLSFSLDLLKNVCFRGLGKPVVCQSETLSFDTSFSALGERTSFPIFLELLEWNGFHPMADFFVGCGFLILHVHLYVAVFASFLRFTFFGMFCSSACPPQYSLHGCGCGEW